MKYPILFCANQRPVHRCDIPLHEPPKQFSYPPLMILLFFFPSSVVRLLRTADTPSPPSLYPTPCAQSVEGLIQSACVKFCPVFRRFTSSPGSKKGIRAVLNGSYCKDERVTLGDFACHRARDAKRHDAPCGRRSNRTRFYSNTCRGVKTAAQNCAPETHTKLNSLSIYYGTLLRQYNLNV
jgi:hypothetical protein